MQDNPKKKILLIEDNIDTQLIYKIYLRNLFDIDVAETAESGINLFRENKYDLMILDINLPGKSNGISVLNEIRNNFKNHDFPVLVVTAYSMEGDREKFISQGADDYLSKPVNKDDFLNKINSFTTIQN